MDFFTQYTVLTILSGAFFVLVGALKLFSSQSASNWPTSEATILKSELGIETSKTGDNTGVMKCFPKISYSYVVGEKELSSTKIFEKERPMDRLQAQEVVDSFNTGDKVDAFYNPKKPEEVYLDPHRDSLGYYLLILGLLLLILPAIQLLAAMS